MPAKAGIQNHNLFKMFGFPIDVTQGGELACVELACGELVESVESVEPGW